ncbi:MAG: pantetheine-phosphate adenylyltransferase [Clostridiales bacterium]|nr:pantetheine-phosphate adenylyltransferase [Clostridiales bacterium]
MKIAVCPGSFDPITNGHLDIIRRSAKLFDKIIVVVGKNYNKSTPCFTLAERVELIKRSTTEIKNVEVDMFDGLIADYARRQNAVAIVKGLRAVSDFEYEFQQALINKKINPELETVFVTANAEYMFLSSSIVKQMCIFGSDISEFVPIEICHDVVERIKSGS